MVPHLWPLFEVLYIPLGHFELSMFVTLFSCLLTKEHRAVSASHFKEFPVGHSFNVLLQC